MASIKKYTFHSVGRLLLHNNRISNDGVIHSNEEIDSERTKYNYHLKKGNANSVRERVDELFHIKNKQMVVMAEMIVSLPQDVKEEDENYFFRSVYDFCCEDFGEKNIINAVVHKDETQPHIHIDFIPVLQGEFEMKSSRGKKCIEKWEETYGEKPHERICSKELLNRKYLLNFHSRLSKYVEKDLGYKTEILNGATVNGNKTILKLKEETLKKDIEDLEKKKKYLGKEIESFLNIARQNGLEEEDLGLYPLAQKINELKRQNEILKNIITREGYKIKKSDLDLMKEREYTLSKVVKVNIKDGSLVNEELDEDAIVVIEVYKNTSPQQKILEEDIYLNNQVRMFINSANQVSFKHSRMDEKIYALIKADTQEQVINNLLDFEMQLEEREYKDRKIYMDRFKKDKFDFARSILVKDNIEAIYFTGEVEEQKSKENEKTNSKEI